MADIIGQLDAPKADMPRETLRGVRSFIVQYREFPTLLLCGPHLQISRMFSMK
jgi:hypothetical protein